MPRTCLSSTTPCPHPVPFTHSWEPVKPGLPGSPCQLAPPRLWLHAQPGAHLCPYGHWDVFLVPTTDPELRTRQKSLGRLGWDCTGMADGVEGGCLAGDGRVQEGKVAGPGRGGRKTYRSSCSRRGEALCRILLWASACSMLSALSPLMATMMSPGRRSAASALPRSVTYREEEPEAGW